MMQTPFSLFIKQKNVIGMLHFAPLAGEPGHLSIDVVVKHAMRDIKALNKGGINGILVENWYADSVTPYVTKATALCFEHVLQKIAPRIHVPWGINVLHNDYPLSFSLAKKFHADFVQLDVFVDDVKSAFSYSQKAKHHPFKIHPDPAAIQKCATTAGNISFIVFIQPKHYEMLIKNKSLIGSAREAKKFGAAGVIVTKATGIAPEMKKIKLLKKALGTFLVGIGSGVTVRTVKQFLSVGDFCIVGTALKKQSDIHHLVDPKRVKQLMKNTYGNKRTFLL